MMQLNTIDQEILSIVHCLPTERQREILNFSLFLKESKHFDKQHEIAKQHSTSFVSALKEFLKEVESDPLDIDISVFDRNRPRESG